METELETLVGYNPLERWIIFYIDGQFMKPLDGLSHRSERDALKAAEYMANRHWTSKYQFFITPVQIEPKGIRVKRSATQEEEPNVHPGSQADQAGGPAAAPQDISPVVG
jgi:hypothetical protein